MMGGWVEEKTVRINEQRLNESFQGVNRRQKELRPQIECRFQVRSSGGGFEVLEVWLEVPPLPIPQELALSSPPPPSPRSSAAAR